MFKRAHTARNENFSGLMVTTAIEKNSDVLIVSCINVMRNAMENVIMKDMFRSFKKPTEEELKELWENAVFVFDTNVLHSVYRYQSETCEEVLRLMEQLQDRIWIPYHVALEFHRNRLSVIASQHKKFAETRKAIKKAVETLGKDLEDLQLKKRHSHIDPAPLLEGISKLTDDYLLKLISQETSCLKVESEDPLLGRIESILNGRVGGKPEDSVIKNIMNLGKERYKTLTPPGYKDAGKEKEPDNKYIYGGINYERQFGDLIVWQQIIQYAKEEGKKHLIFVTDDSKEDWWQKMQGKTIGFRNELIDEIYSKTGLHLFNAYFLGGFLTSAQKYLKEDVSEKTIGEVNESSKTMNIDDALTEMEHRPYSSALEDAVAKMGHHPYSSALEDAVAKIEPHSYSSDKDDDK